MVYVLWRHGVLAFRGMVKMYAAALNEDYGSLLRVERLWSGPQTTF